MYTQKIFGEIENNNHSLEGRSSQIRTDSPPLRFAFETNIEDVPKEEHFQFDYCYLLGGNPAFNNAENKEKRQKLQSDREIGKLLRRYYKTYETRKNSERPGFIHKSEATFVNLLISKALLVQEDWSEEEAWKIVEQDWERESHGLDWMSEDQIKGSLFEIADMWTNDVRKRSYVRFLTDLYKCITKPVDEKLEESKTPGVRQWAKLEEVVQNKFQPFAAGQSRQTQFSTKHCPSDPATPASSQLSQNTPEAGQWWRSKHHSWEDEDEDEEEEEDEDDSQTAFPEIKAKMYGSVPPEQFLNGSAMSPGCGSQITFSNQDEAGITHATFKSNASSYSGAHNSGLVGASGSSKRNHTKFEATDHSKTSAQEGVQPAKNQQTQQNSSAFQGSQPLNLQRTQVKASDIRGAEPASYQHLNQMPLCNENGPVENAKVQELVNGGEVVRFSSDTKRPVFMTDVLSGCLTRAPTPGKPGSKSLMIRKTSKMRREHDFEGQGKSPSPIHHGFPGIDEEKENNYNFPEAGYYAHDQHSELFGMSRTNSRFSVNNHLTDWARKSGNKLQLQVHRNQRIPLRKVVVPEVERKLIPSSSVYPHLDDDDSTTDGIFFEVFPMSLDDPSDCSVFTKSCGSTSSLTDLSYLERVSVHSDGTQSHGPMNFTLMLEKLKKSQKDLAEKIKTDDTEAMAATYFPIVTSLPYQSDASHKSPNTETNFALSASPDLTSLPLVSSRTVDGSDKGEEPLDYKEFIAAELEALRQSPCMLRPKPVRALIIKRSLLKTLKKGRSLAPLGAYPILNLPDTQHSSEAQSNICQKVQNQCDLSEKDACDTQLHSNEIIKSKPAKKEASAAVRKQSPPVASWDVPEEVSCYLESVSTCPALQPQKPTKARKQGTGKSFVRQFFQEKSQLANI